MSAHETLVRAKFAGVTLTAHDGQIVAKGTTTAVEALIPELRQHKAELLELLTTAVTVEVPGRATCDMAVPREKVADFMTEATRRGLIVRYKIQGHDTVSTVMPGPGQTAEQLRESLRAELGDRLEVES